MNNKTDELGDKVIKFVSNETGIKENKLELESSFFHDFGVDGEDALELLEAFSKKFNVDVSDFPFQDYFGNEGTMSPFGLIKGLIFGKLKDVKKRLTVNDLIQSVKLGCLKVSD